MDELNMSWEDKLKKTQSIQKERYVCCACVSKTLRYSWILSFGDVSTLSSGLVPRPQLFTPGQRVWWQFAPCTRSPLSMSS